MTFKVSEISKIAVTPLRITECLVGRLLTYEISIVGISVISCEKPDINFFPAILKISNDAISSSV